MKNWVIEAGLPLRKRIELRNKDLNMVMRLRKRWVEDIEEDMQTVGIRQWRKQCEERVEWKRITKKAKTHSGL